MGFCGGDVIGERVKGVRYREGDGNVGADEAGDHASKVGLDGVLGGLAAAAE